MLKLSRRLLLSAWILEAAQNDLSIGGIRFTVVRHGLLFGQGKNRYLHVHGNETTARDVLRDHMRKVKGTAYFVVSDKRQVTIGAAQIDPNRMFSGLGAEASLRRLNRQAPNNQVAAALALLDIDRERFVKAVLPPKTGRMVAMHNNGTGYSMDDEVPISEKVSRKDPDNPREFMLATDPKDYERIATGPFNVVLQSALRGPEDGSFSRLAASRGLRYINIEAALGKGEKQANMIAFLEGVLP